MEGKDSLWGEMKGNWPGHDQLREAEPNERPKDHPRKGRRHSRWGSPYCHLYRGEWGLARRRRKKIRHKSKPAIGVVDDEKGPLNKMRPTMRTDQIGGSRGRPPIRGFHEKNIKSGVHGEEEFDSLFDPAAQSTNIRPSVRPSGRFSANEISHTLFKLSRRKDDENDVSSCDIKRGEWRRETCVCVK